MTKRTVNLKRKPLWKVTDKKQVVLCRLWTAGAAIGLLGGTGVSVMSVLLIVCDLLSRDKSGGSWLLLPVLPLWVFGAHCLDKAEEAENRFP